MSGFVEIAKIVIKVGFFVVLAGLIVAILIVPLDNLAGILQFLNGISSVLLTLISFVYSVLYYWTSGAFGLVYLAVMAVVVTKVTFWSIYWIIQGYKIVTEWLFK